MADDNHVEQPEPGDEIPGIPVPGDEVQGTPMSEPTSADRWVDDDDPPRKVKASVGTGSRRWPLLLGAGCLLTCCLCCIAPLCLLAITGAGLAAVLSNSETTSTHTEQFTVNPDVPLTLVVDASAGEVDIRHNGSGDTVSITYTKKAYGWTKNAAEKELERITVDAVQPADNENEITVTVDTERHEDSFWFLANQVDMMITVPEEVAITVNNNTGAIHVRDVHVHSLDLRSNTGGITFTGSIDAGAQSPLRLETNTGAISVNLPADAAAQIDAGTDTGSINVAGFDRMTDVNERQSGAGEVWTGTLGTSSNPPVLRLHTNTGSISVQVR